METQKLFNRNLVIITLGQIISLFGSAILRFAIPLHILKITGSPAIFGMVLALSFLPVIVLSFVGGILADRLNKRNIMVVLDFITAGVIVFLLLSLESLPIVPLCIVAMMILFGISGIYQPTVQATIPSIVEGDNILKATAIVNQISSLSGLIGPIIGGVLYGGFGLYPILIISTICYIFSAIMQMFIKITHVKQDNSIGVIQIVKTDFSISKNYMVNKKPIILKIILLISIFNLLFTAVIIVGNPILIVNTLKLKDSMLGFAEGAFAVGGLCGGIFTALLGHKIKLSKSYISLILCAVLVGIIGVPIIIGASPYASYTTILVCGFLIMMLTSFISIKLMSTVQMETPKELVGKIIACMMSLAMCTMPLGQALYGYLFEVFSSNVYIVLFIASAGSMIIAIMAKYIFKDIDTEKVIEESKGTSIS
ncbi:MAG: MFS transporter [Clostridium sp.]